MLHIIPEEAPEEEEEEAEPGSSEEGSDELSEDDIEDLVAPPQSPKTQLSLFYFMSDCRNIWNCVLFLICISRVKEIKPEQNPKGTVSSPHSDTPRLHKKWLSGFILF